MPTYKTEYAVTTTNGNAFMIKQPENLGLLTIATLMLVAQGITAGVYIGDSNDRA